MTIKQINEIAKYEGWGLFACHGISEIRDGTILIQKVDDEEMDFFYDDDKAFDHVKKLADMGSHLHQHALAILEHSAFKL